MFGPYDANMNTVGNIIDKIIPASKKTQQPIKFLSNVLASPLAQEVPVVEEPPKKPHKKVYREYPEKNDSVSSIVAINPYSFLPEEKKEDSCTEVVLLCDLCYCNIEGTVVSSNCELQHKCRYHADCWKKLMIGESILCLRHVTTKPHYLTSYDDKELIVPEKEYNTTRTKIVVEEEITEDVVEIKEWQSSYRATDVNDIPVHSKPLVSEYAIRKKRKNVEKQRKRLELCDFHALANKEAREKKIRLDSNASIFIHRQ